MCLFALAHSPVWIVYSQRKRRIVSLIQWVRRDTQNLKRNTIIFDHYCFLAEGGPRYIDTFLHMLQSYTRSNPANFKGFLLLYNFVFLEFLYLFHRLVGPSHYGAKYNETVMTRRDFTVHDKENGSQEASWQHQVR